MHPIILFYLYLFFSLFIFFVRPDLYNFGLQHLILIKFFKEREREREREREEREEREREREREAK